MMSDLLVHVDHSMIYTPRLDIAVHMRICLVCVPLTDLFVNLTFDYRIGRVTGSLALISVHGSARMAKCGIALHLAIREYRCAKPLFPGHCEWRVVPRSEGRAICRRNNRLVTFFVPRRTTRLFMTLQVRCYSL
jgi:hypothetical protein